MIVCKDCGNKNPNGTTSSENNTVKTALRSSQSI